MCTTAWKTSHTPNFEGKDPDLNAKWTVESTFSSNYGQMGNKSILDVHLHRFVSHVSQKKKKLAIIFYAINLVGNCCLAVWFFLLITKHYPQGKAWNHLAIFFFHFTWPIHHHKNDEFILNRAPACYIIILLSFDPLICRKLSKCQTKSQLLPLQLSNVEFYFGSYLLKYYFNRSFKILWARVRIIKSER